MTPRFEHINGKLCRMVEQPCHHCGQPEIIAEPVKEGSKEWALYQMMQGKAITFFDQPSRVLKLVNGYVQDSINGGYWDRKSGNEFLSYASSTGWKIHEPKPLLADAKDGDKVKLRNGDVYVLKIQKNELLHGFDYLVCSLTHDVYGYYQTSHEESPFDIIELIPEPQFKVGDWVEFIDAGSHKSQGKYLSNAYDNAILVQDTTYNMRCVVPMTKITRKLSPSYVVVDFGSFRGKIELNSHPFGKQITVKNKQGDAIAYINIDYLDIPTRELVRELIKKQEEEK